jgi:hypothetical protein
MIRITINKKRFFGVYSWEEMTLQRFCDLASIPMPDGYEGYIIADGKFSTENIDEYIHAVEKITDKQLKEDFPAYYRKVILCLSDIPESLLSDELVNDLYEWHFKPFVLSLIYNTPVIHFCGQVQQYQPETVKWFRVGLNWFKLPETVRVMDQDIPLANEPIISYSEASDIFRGMRISSGDVKRLSLFMAIYCRKRGEKYSERNALERQPLMMRVPMSIVWSVFFYTLRRLPGSLTTIRLFGRLPKQIHEVRERVRAWQDTDRGDSFMNVPDTADLVELAK